MKIGVLAVQGAFIEHEHMIEEIGLYMKIILTKTV